jgi:hypothetical protein
MSANLRYLRKQSQDPTMQSRSASTSAPKGMSVGELSIHNLAGNRTSLNNIVKPLALFVTPTYAAADSAS